MTKVSGPIALLLTLGLLAPGSALACEYPPSPRLPNGETASYEQMAEAQKNVRAYLAAAETYLACLEAAEQDTEAPPTAEQSEINLKRYNAMVDEMHRVSDEFNVAVRIYKARQ